MIPVDRLKPGSIWMHFRTREYYTIVTLALDPEGSVQVVYSNENHEAFTRRLDEFLGSVESDLMKSGFRNHVSRFQPVEV